MCNSILGAQGRASLRPCGPVRSSHGPAAPPGRDETPRRCRTVRPPPSSPPTQEDPSCRARAQSTPRGRLPLFRGASEAVSSALGQITPRGILHRGRVEGHPPATAAGQGWGGEDRPGHRGLAVDPDHLDARRHLLVEHPLRCAATPFAHPRDPCDPRGPGLSGGGRVSSVTYPCRGQHTATGPAQRALAAPQRSASLHKCICAIHAVVQ